MARHRSGLLLVAAALAAGGCSAYDFRRVYEAAPGTAEARLDEAGVLTSVVVRGVRRHPENGPPGAGPIVEVLVAVENHGPAPLQLDPAAIEIADARGRALPATTASVAGIMTVPAGGIATVAVSAPFPAEDAGAFDLESLQVRIPLEPGGARVATFRRQPSEYYDRYPRRTGSGYRRVDLPPDSSAPR